MKNIYSTFAAVLFLSAFGFSQTHPNLDDTNTGWASCDISCAGGTGTASAFPRTINNPTPSLDGEAMEVSVTGPALSPGQTTNVLWYDKVGANNTLNTFTGIYNVNFPSLSNVAAAEYDQFQFNAGTRFMMGSQCLIGGVWQIWNSCGANWVNTAVACNLTANAWHSITWNTHRDPLTSTACSGHPCEYYDSLTFDSTIYHSFPAQPACSSSDGDNVGIQVQIDLNSSGGTATEFVDEMSLTASVGAPNFSYSPNPVAMGNVNLGVTNTQTVTITNSGTGALSIGTITSNNAQFTLTLDHCSGQSVASTGGTCTFGLAFMPSSTGLQSATITVPDNAGNPDAISTNGTGVATGAFFYGSGSGSGSFMISFSPSSVTCGPPTYPCSNASTSNTGTIASIFTASAPTSSTCTGQCQNSVAYDTTLNPVGTDPYVRVTDPSTSCAAAGQSFNATNSGGDNDNMWSLNEDYLLVTMTGGFNCVLNLNPTPVAVQVINTGVPGISFTGAPSFSRTIDTRFFVLKSLTQIWQYNITSNTTTTSSMLVDVATSGVCPGLPNPFGATSASVFTGSSTDDTFIFSLSNAGGQNTAIWTVAWSRTRGCSTVNMQTGSVWAFCTSSCTPSTSALGTLNTTGGCWGAAPTSPGGIHDTLATTDGNYAWMTISGTWSQGACAGLATNIGYSVWQVGTTNSQFCSSQQTSIATGCVDHTSIGYNHAASNYYNGPNRRAAGAVSTAIQFAPAYSPLLEDWHSAWPAGIVDTNPIIIATDLVNSTNGSGCSSSSVYCPIYLHNEIYALSPIATYPPGNAPIRFGHTFSCGAGGGGKGVCTGGADFYFQGQQSIMSCSQSGKHCALTSTMLGSLGNDSNGHPRQDIFVITLN